MDPSVHVQVLSPLLHEDGLDSCESYPPRISRPLERTVCPTGDSLRIRSTFCACESLRVQYSKVFLASIR